MAETELRTELAEVAGDAWCGIPTVQISQAGRQAQRFLGAHAAVSNLFNLGRHLVRANHYRDLRMSAFEEWDRVVA